MAKTKKLRVGDKVMTTNELGTPALSGVVVAVDKHLHAYEVMFIDNCSAVFRWLCKRHELVRLCNNCGLKHEHHANGKCLYAPTSWS